MSVETEQANRVQVAVVIVAQTGITYLTTHDIESTLRALFVSTFVMLTWLLWMRRKRGD